MMSAKSFESGNRDTERETKKKGITRRDFMFAGAAALAGAALAPKVMRGVSEWNAAQEAKKFNEVVEREKEKIKKDIARGLKAEHDLGPLFTADDNLQSRMRGLDKKSDAYNKLNTEATKLSVGIAQSKMHRGVDSLGLLAEANPYAEELQENKSAITALATARVLYTEGAGTGELLGSREFPYWHNLASAYLELENKQQWQIKATFKELFEYTSYNHIEVSRIPPEQILYSLIDGDFDFSLKTGELKALLDKNFPTWQQPRHPDRDYAHYNDLSVLDLVELNRLTAVISQIKDPGFVSDVFTCRDENVKNPNIGQEGVIPLPRQERHLQVIPPGKTRTGHTRHQLELELFASAAKFHFHADKKNMEPEEQGPDSQEWTFFGPGVVFSSVNDSTILVHFYASRKFRDASGDESGQNEVVCLGEIKRPALPLPGDENKRPDSPTQALAKV